MKTAKGFKQIGYTRRRFLCSAAMTVAVTQFGATDFAEAQSGNGQVTAASEPDIIRPFHIYFPDADLDYLRGRVLMTRWPDKETVPDLMQGVSLATVQELARYWVTDYNWGKGEAKQNTLRQF